MPQKPLVLAITLLASLAPLAGRAQQPPASPRPAVVLDAGAIRKQAAQMAEVRGLLSDPDPNVRLLAIREIARSGDPIQRQLAIDAGLSSAETSMQQVALRAVVADTSQIFVTMSKADGTPITEGASSFALSLSKFDVETGKMSGNCWEGQLQGAVFAFNQGCGGPNGSLVWDTEAGEFRGMVNLSGNAVTGIRKAVWRPR